MTYKSVHGMNTDILQRGKHKYTGSKLLGKSEREQGFVIPGNIKQVGDEMNTKSSALKYTITF